MCITKTTVSSTKYIIITTVTIIDSRGGNSSKQLCLEHCLHFHPHPSACPWTRQTPDAAARSLALTRVIREYAKTRFLWRKDKKRPTGGPKDPFVIVKNSNDTNSESQSEFLYSSRGEIAFRCDNSYTKIVCMCVCVQRLPVCTFHFLYSDPTPLYKQCAALASVSFCASGIEV